ncbi:MAG: hypothetical protein WA639_02870, partial [Candidatus Acidiferrum sp.]
MIQIKFPTFFGKQPLLFVFRRKKPKYKHPHPNIYAAIGSFDHRIRVLEARKVREPDQPLQL